MKQPESFTATGLLQQIQKEFPDLTWRSHRHIRRGWDHDVMILDNRWVFRFPKHSSDTKSLLAEIELMHYLSKKLSLSVPQYERIAENGKFAGYRIIPGNILLASRYRQRVRSKARMKISQQLGRFLTQLHSTPFNTVRRYGIQSRDRRKEFAGWHRVLRDVYPKLTKREVEQIERNFEECQALRPHPKDVFAHADLTEDHLLVTARHAALSGIIDFSDAAITDPAIDFAGLWEYGPKFVKRVYTAYRGPKDHDLLRRSLLGYRLIALDWMRDAIVGEIPADWPRRSPDYWRTRVNHQLSVPTDKMLARLRAF